jgi:hypothetical protein
MAHFNELPFMVHTIPFAGMRNKVHGLLVLTLKREANKVVCADVE